MSEQNENATNIECITPASKGSSCGMSDGMAQRLEKGETEAFYSGWDEGDGEACDAGGDSITSVTAPDLGRMSADTGEARTLFNIRSWEGGKPSVRGSVLKLWVWVIGGVARNSSHERPNETKKLHKN